jgi:hypothetical protein
MRTGLWTLTWPATLTCQTKVLCSMLLLLHRGSVRPVHLAPRLCVRQDRYAKTCHLVAVGRPPAFVYKNRGCRRIRCCPPPPPSSFTSSTVHRLPLLRHLPGSALHTGVHHGEGGGGGDQAELGSASGQCSSAVFASLWVVGGGELVQGYVLVRVVLRLCGLVHDVVVNVLWFVRWLCPS